MFQFFFENFIKLSLGIILDLLDNINFESPTSVDKAFTPLIMASPKIFGNPSVFEQSI